MIQLVILILIFVSHVKPNKRNENDFLRLPMGEYRAIFKTIYNCNPVADKIQFNYYLNKKPDNSTEVKGNMTALIPIDDSLLVDANIAIKDVNGAWKENSFLFHSEKACSTAKKFTTQIDLSGLGFNFTCPITAGTYIATGLDTSNYKKLNYIPKTFPYGTYKVRFVLKDKKKQSYGCLMSIIQVVRP
ncbi:LOW QUALITY PROTEIN: uncharacterized protein LOC132932404 [Rhopalosiphum padi]|uniref:LOW QUALITY PROTEIN: uncharacterized protein LOC132932404 n=1 Tax=Rhopalosiphum padi TaxID=40932 RepID=UPI00298E0EF1|nr:LOW QUALITY PROTEIN: uncharacterized protein LOC132932404 [Rhopalosiphum padi]